MPRRPRKRRTGLLLWGLVTVATGLGVLWYSKKHPGVGAKALFVAWLLPGMPPPGPLG